MVDYTLSSYEETLKTYDQNIENVKGRSSKEIEDLTEIFSKTQEDVKNDQFLSLSEKSRVLKKRQEGFDQLKKEKERQLKVDLDTEIKNKENFMDQNGGLDYHCFITLNEINKLKEEKLSEVNQNLVQKQEELARLQAEIESQKQEVEHLKGDLNSIQSGTLYEAFFEFDVMPRIKKVEASLKILVDGHKSDYVLSSDFVSRTIRCLTKECKKQKGLLNYEGGKLKLSFDTVENWTKGESATLKREVINILTDCGFVISKMKTEKSGLNGENIENNTVGMSASSRERESTQSSKQYLKEVLLLLDKEDIQGRIDIFKQLGFSFASECAFIKQVNTAMSEGVDIVEDIDKWLQLYLTKPGGIEVRTGKKKTYFKISLDCRQRKPRILMTGDENNSMKILCVAPHVDYDNILKGQTTNYFKTWKGHWTTKGKQGRKTGRA